ncbi:hypothetical protein J6A31_00955 [bacterium]|nr:hypothetical protein [bacterium]
MNKYNGRRGRIAIDAFKNNSAENPGFAKIKVYRPSDSNGEICVWKGLVASTGLSNDYSHPYMNEQVVFRAMEDGTKLYQNSFSDRIKRTVGFICDTDFEIEELLEPTDELRTEYDKCLNDITITVSYCDYDETLSKFGYASKIDGTEKREVIPNAHNIDDGVKWMLENRPAQYMGMSVYASCGDMLCTAVPCPEYEKGLYETRQGREKYAKMEAERLGVNVGEFDYSLADSILNRGKETDIQSTPSVNSEKNYEI